MKIQIVLLLYVKFVISYGHLKLVCYWPNWDSTGEHNNNPENIDAKLCSHIHYSFAILDPDSLKIKFEDPNTESEFVRKLNELKRINANLKVIIALGGWSDSASDKYSRLVESQTARESFVQHSIRFLKQYSFDGLDLDWEFPVCWQTNCSAGPPSDRDNFALLLQVIYYYCIPDQH